MLQTCMEHGFTKPIEPADIVVSLYDFQKNPIRSWCCTRAWPVKWETDTLDAEKNSVLIETIELAYQELKRIL